MPWRMYLAVTFTRAPYCTARYPSTSCRDMETCTYWVGIDDPCHLRDLRLSTAMWAVRDQKSELIPTSAATLIYRYNDLVNHTYTYGLLTLGSHFYLGSRKASLFVPCLVRPAPFHGIHVDQPMCAYNIVASSSFISTCLYQRTKSSSARH
ncbi:hypothetical protein F4861DRAFT_432942 [Xylaria intraflava]|nr:hypothetical protein F4861DRAFT_432942 [Xylaria intraflava]